MRIAIVGFARDGMAAFEFLNRDGNEIVVCDGNEKVEVPAGVESQLGDGYLKGLDRFDLIVRTAGLSPRKIAEANPESPDILQKVTGNIDLFYENSPSKNIIGVTGTKGKGTTSTLIAKMLEAAGKKVHLGGNIGIPALELLKNNVQPDDWIVLEQSSFQLIDQKHSPHIAVCLMVEPEHLDWHKDMAEYTHAKQQLFAYQTADDTAIYFAQNDNSKSIADAGPGTKIPYFADPGALVESDEIKINGRTICKTNELKLLGEHNWQNVCAAITAVWQVTQDVEAIRSVATTFSGLEHRLEFVRELNGIKFYNDSFASAPPAPIAAMQAIKDMKVMILGGFDRNLDLKPLVEAIKNSKDSIRKLLLIGVSAERLANELKQSGYDNFELSSEKDMTSIVGQAKTIAQNGDAIILSPGFPSFDMFKDFEDRGLQYKEAVKKLS